MLYKMTEVPIETVIPVETAAAPGPFEFPRTVVTSNRLDKFVRLRTPSGPIVSTPEMDTRILTLLVIISVAGSLAELHVPFYRVRRNGLQENDLRADTEFVETLRAKRQSIFESTDDSTTTPKDSTTASAPSTTPANTTPKKPNPPTKPKPSSPSAPKPNSPAPKPSTPAPKPRPRPSKPNSAIQSIPSRPATNPTTLQTDPTTPEPNTSPSEATTTPKPSDTEEPEEPKSTTPKVGLGSRIDGEEPDQEPSEVKKPPVKPLASSAMKPATNPAMNPAANPAPSGYPQNGYMPQSTFPNFSPFSSPYNPYGDPTFNSIPGPNNFAWTGTSQGQGAAGSFASAGASSGASSFGGGYGYGGGTPNQPSLADRGAFVDNTPNVGNTPNYGYTPNSGYPNAGYAPNTGSVGGFGFSGVGTGLPFQDPNAFVFPEFNPEAFQRQMEEQFRQLHNQFQKQQQALFETANRIGTDGFSGSHPGGNTAVSSISLGPQGGYQAGAIHPAAPGVQSRFGEDIPAPSGNSYGVFSSSSSKTVIGPDGKPISHKTSTTGVNDNGNISYHTVRD